MDKDDRRAINAIEDLKKGPRCPSARRDPEKIWQKICEHSQMDREMMIEELPNIRVKVARDIAKKEGLEPTEIEIAGTECLKYEYLSRTCVLPSCSAGGKIRKFIMGDPDLIVTRLCDEHYSEILESDEIMTREEFIEMDQDAS